jgi:hypothetical protein
MGIAPPTTPCARTSACVTAVWNVCLDDVSAALSPDSSLRFE